MTITLCCEQLFQHNKIIPVIVLNEVNKAIPIARALLLGGISIMEVTLRTPNALTIIKKIAQEVPEMIVGAGTVLNDEQYHRAVEHDAKFIVSPGLTDKLADVHSNYDVPFLPGAVTPGEIMQAMLLGFKYLKFFPSESYNGCSTLKSLASPFSEIKFCPTGGINLDNIQKYLSLPNVVGVGCSFLVTDELVKQNNFNQITVAAQQALSLTSKN